MARWTMPSRFCVFGLLVLHVGEVQSHAVLTQPPPRDPSRPGTKFTPFATAITQANAGCVNAAAVSVGPYPTFAAGAEMVAGLKPCPTYFQM